jgi:hypothetical protein
MKKLFATFLFLGLFAASTFAQSKLDVGIRLSPIISTATAFNAAGVKVEGYRARMGFIPGLMANYNFTPNFGLHSGLSFKMHGYGYGGDSTLSTFKVSVSSIEIPVGFRLRTPEIGGSTGIHIRAILGANADINVGGKMKVGSIESKLTNSAPVAVGAFGSLGIDWTLDKIGRFDLGVRYNHGLTDQVTKNGAAKLNLSYIGLDLGYYFNWGE